MWINELNVRWITASSSAVIILMWFLTSISDYHLHKRKKWMKRLGGKKKYLISSVVESRTADTAGGIPSCWLGMSVFSSISIATHSFSFTTLNTWCRAFCVTLMTPPMTVWVCECVWRYCIGVSLTDRFNSLLREPCARCAGRCTHVHTQHTRAATTPTHHW